MDEFPPLSPPNQPRPPAQILSSKPISIATTTTAQEVLGCSPHSTPPSMRSWPTITPLHTPPRLPTGGPLNPRSYCSPPNFAKPPTPRTSPRSPDTSPRSVSTHSCSPSISPHSSETGFLESPQAINSECSFPLSPRQQSDRPTIPPNSTSIASVDSLSPLPLFNFLEEAPLVPPRSPMESRSSSSTSPPSNGLRILSPPHPTPIPPGLNLNLVSRTSSDIASSSSSSTPWFPQSARRPSLRSTEKDPLESKVKLLVNRLICRGDIPSLTALRVHYLLYVWFSGLIPDDQRHAENASLKTNTLKCLNALSESGGLPPQMMLDIQRRLKAVVETAEQQAGEGPCSSDEARSWRVLLQNLVKFRDSATDFKQFFRLFKNLSSSDPAKTIVLEAIGGRKVLKLLQKLQGKHASQFVQSRLQTYAHEEVKCTQLREALSHQTIPWTSNTLALLDEMSLIEALRGVATDRAMVFKDLRIEHSHGMPVIFTQPDGTNGPLRHPDEYGIGDSFLGQAIVLRDIITALSTTDYLPVLNLDVTILGALEKSLASVPVPPGPHPINYTYTTTQPGCPLVQRVSDEAFEVSAVEKTVIQFMADDGEIHQAATQYLTWVFKFENQNPHFSCELTKDLNFESWVPEEHRLTLEKRAAEGKALIAKDITTALREAHYEEAKGIDIAWNVQRVLDHKLASVSRVIAALSNGSFAPAVLLHKQHMNLPEEYKIQFLQGRYNTLRIIAPNVFEVIALRNANIISPLMDTTTLILAEQAVKWILTCNEEQNTLTGQLSMDIKFEPWTPDDVRMNILKGWQSQIGLSSRISR